MTKHILIDGDILTYRVGFSVEAPVYVVNGNIYKRKGMAQNAAKEQGADIHKRKNIGSFLDLTRNLNIAMRTMFDDIGSRNFTMYLTDSSLAKNFRTEIATIEVYKGNRAQVAKPFYYKKIRELLVRDYKAVLISGEEADDALGIAQYAAAKRYGNFDSTVIASIDKDLRVLEGDHYHMVHRQIQHVSRDEALKNFCRQLLAGDATDCVPGITRILKHLGRKEDANKLSYSHYLAKAVEYFVDHTPKECYDYVINVYNEQGIDQKLVDEVADLVWIRRNENENFTDWIKTNEF